MPLLCPSRKQDMYVFARFFRVWAEPMGPDSLLVSLKQEALEAAACVLDSTGASTPNGMLASIIFLRAAKLKLRPRARRRSSSAAPSACCSWPLRARDW